MKAYVYHAKKPKFESLREGILITIPELDHNYDCAAVVELDDHYSIGDALEKVFEDTNHIGGEPWWLNEGVTRKNADCTRSTSVGDLVVIECTDGQEHFYSVAVMGWRRFRI